MPFRFLFLLLLLVGLPGPSVSLFAQVIASERFAYPPGAALAGQGTATDGWAGPWQLIDGTDEGALPATDTLIDLELAIRSVPPFGLLTSGNSHRLERQLAQPIDPAQGPVWFSFLSEAGTADLRTKGAVALLDYSFDSLFTQRIDLGKKYASNELVSDGVTRYPRPTGRSYLRGRWTVLLLLPDGPGRVRSYTWVDPDPVLGTPDTAEAQVRNRKFHLRRIDAVQLLALGESGLAWRVDDLYFGRTFADVIPGDWVAVDTEDLTLSVREPFDYPADQGLSGRAGGRGFAAPWQRVTGFDHPVRDEAIEFAGDRTSQAPVLELDHATNTTNARFVRTLAQPVSDDGGEYWFGAILETNYTTNDNVAQVFLADINSLGPGGPGGQLLQFGKSFQNDRLALGAPPGNYNSTTVLASGNYWVVVRIQTSGNADPESIDLWVDPNPLLAQPPESDIAVSHSLPLNTGWNAVGVKVEGSAGIELRVDELALGERFPDIVPPYLLTATTDPAPDSPWRIFPNPGSDGRVMFRGGEHAELRSIEVFDSAGRRLRRCLPPADAQTPVPILLPSTPAGTYHVLLRTDRGNFTLSYLHQ